MSTLKARYDIARTKRSGINEHIATFSKYASECSSVTELGIRAVVSSWGFLHGLTQKSQKSLGQCTLVGVDLVHHPNIDILATVAKNNGVNYKFIQGDSAKVDIDVTDILFIDTWHVYGHLKRELEAHHSKVRKYIMMHDTTVDGEQGESIRVGWDIPAQAIASGYSEEEIRKGLWPAVEEFLAAHPEWKLHHRYTNNNGLTILKRI